MDNHPSVKIDIDIKVDVHFHGAPDASALAALTRDVQAHGDALAKALGQAQPDSSPKPSATAQAASTTT